MHTYLINDDVNCFTRRWVPSQEQFRGSSNFATRHRAWKKPPRPRATIRANSNGLSPSLPIIYGVDFITATTTASTATTTAICEQKTIVRIPNQ